MPYEVIIGLEVHAQLLTRSKMFCRCSADYAKAPPNTHVCPVCQGLPGVLPTINRRAIEYTVMTALALSCAIAEWARFDRKNYPYPDLMKGYQISQYDNPIGRNGWLSLDLDDQKKRINIIRVHLEEDVAKLFHRTAPWGESYSLVDINRAGVPLMEIVGAPDIRSPEEARLYLIKLRNILQFLGVSTGNMEEGSFRCDANISLRPLGGVTSSTKVEVKNMNSFRAVQRALEYEAERQAALLDRGERLVQETRGWVEEKGITVSQRSKEYAHDYRYFPEPDLPPLVFSREWVEEVRARLPEMPDARRDQFLSQYGLTPYEANLLTGSRAMADFFEACLEGVVVEARPKRAKAVSNWLLGEFSRLLNEKGLEVSQVGITPHHLRQLLDLVEKGSLTLLTAKQVFEQVFETGQMPSEILSKGDLVQISGTAELEQIIGQILAHHPQAVADYRGGKEQALTFLVGQVMRATKGRANPKVANELLHQKLAESKP